VPAGSWNEIARMTGCGLAVAAVAAPVGAGCWLVARRAGEPILARVRPWRVPWTGWEVVLAFLMLTAVVPAFTFQALEQFGFYTRLYGPDFPPAPAARGPRVEAAAAVAGAAAAAAAHEKQEELRDLRDLWAGAVALPFQLALLVVARRTLYPGWPGPTGRPSVAAGVALAVLAWAVLTPLVLGFNRAVIELSARLGSPPEEHPLVKLAGLRPALDQGLFVFRACVAAPLVEEILFRGLLLPWLLGRRWRVWPALAVGVLLAGYVSHPSGESALALLARGPVLFAVGLAAGYGLLALRARRKRRTVGAVYVSAAVFAAVHSGVWPSPVPLFVLGLGLGWLAVRTRGVLVPAVVHGLFNTVSALFVLSSG